MTLPIFSASDDPGPSFAELLRRTGSPPHVSDADMKDRIEITHGTTVVAVRYADGVVMAGDRRATSGNLISHRTMEKVYAAAVRSRCGSSWNLPMPWLQSIQSIPRTTPVSWQWSTCQLAGRSGVRPQMTHFPPCCALRRPTSSTTGARQPDGSSLASGSYDAPDLHGL